MSDPIHQRDLTAYLAKESEPERQLARLWPTTAPITIFDIGACEGEDSVRYSRRYPSARIHVFEPLPANQAIVRANLAKYGVTNATLQPLALSDREGTAEFHVSTGVPPEKFAGEDWNYGNKSSSLLPPASDAPMYGWIRFSEAIPVKCTTVDAYCAANGIAAIDFIHMDVQGAEGLVLQGAQRMMPRIGSVWLEVSEEAVYRGQKLRAEIERWMRDRGFALIHQENRGTEGDQFYVNGHTWRGRRRILGHRVRRALDRIRWGVGSLRRRFTPSA